MSQPGGLDSGTGIPADFDQAWELRLYVTDRSPKCLLAIENLRRVCEENLAGRYRIEVVDLLGKPAAGRRRLQILAVPAVVRQLPAPIRKLVGDLSDTGAAGGPAGFRLHPGVPGHHQRRGGRPLGPDPVCRWCVRGFDPRHRDRAPRLRREARWTRQPGSHRPASAARTGRRDHVVATPTLVRRLPGPERGTSGEIRRLRLGEPQRTAWTLLHQRPAHGQVTPWPDRRLLPDHGSWPRGGASRVPPGGGTGSGAGPAARGAGDDRGDPRRQIDSLVIGAPGQEKVSPSRAPTARTGSLSRRSAKVPPPSPPAG